MANKITTWEGRRALTDKSGNNSEALAEAARELMSLNQLSEAVSLAGLAGDDSLLREIISLAVEEGNFFVFNSAVVRLKGRTVDKSLIQALKVAAENNGRILYTEQATTWLTENS